MTFNLFTLKAIIKTYFKLIGLIVSRGMLLLLYNNKQIIQERSTLFYR